MRQSRAGKHQRREAIHGHETIEGHLAAWAMLIGGAHVDRLLFGHRVLGHAVLGRALRHFSTISRPSHLALRNGRLRCNLHKQSETEANQGQGANKFHEPAIV